MKTNQLVAILVCATSLTLSVIAATSEDIAKKATVTVNLKETATAQTLKYIGTLSGVKVHYTAPAKNDPLVTIDLKNISAADAFRYVANLANLTVTYKDDGAYFTPKK